ncbi:MAG: hypothetical protein ACRDYZ_03100 [Acidimicrobiales bacterium]
MKRARWVAVGIVIGVAGSVWVRRRFRRRIDRAVATVLPGGLSGGAATSLRQARSRLRIAVDAGREDRARREAELWDDLEGQPRHAKHARPAALDRQPPSAARARGGAVRTRR